MWKAFYNRFRKPVFVFQYAFATKTVPWAFRFWTGTIGVDFSSDRTRYSSFFHGALPVKH